MSIKGSPYPRFQRALETGNLTIVRAAAAELPTIQLDDALSILELMAKAGDPAFDRAAARWAARHCLEKGDVGTAQLKAALCLLEGLPATSPTLRALL